MIIYKVTNKINNKVYIGQTTLSLDERRKYHYKESRRKNDTTYFHNALNKYHYEDFVWEILEDNIDNIDTLNEKEIYYISFYDTYFNGYNETTGGTNGNENACVKIQKNDLLIIYDLLLNSSKTQKEISE
jgi:group I intron endonuclease